MTLISEAISRHLKNNIHIHVANMLKPAPCHFCHRKKNQIPCYATNSVEFPRNTSSILHHDRCQALWVGDIDRLHVAVELLFGAFLVVALSGDADAEFAGDTFDALVPDFLVELWVETDVFGVLMGRWVVSRVRLWGRGWRFDW